MRLFKTAIVATVMASALAGAGLEQPAFAEFPGPVSDSLSFIGSGTFSPGLDLDDTAICDAPDPQTVTFAASAVLAGDEGATLAGLNFNGFDAVGCPNEGQGVGTLGGFASGNVSFVRNGPVMTLTGLLVISPTGDTDSIFAAACIVVPTTVNPTTSFAFVCTAALS